MGFIEKQKKILNIIKSKLLKLIIDVFHIHQIFKKILHVQWAKNILGLGKKLYCLFRNPRGQCFCKCLKGHKPESPFCLWYYWWNVSICFLNVPDLSNIFTSFSVWNLQVGLCVGCSGFKKLMKNSNYVVNFLCKINRQRLSWNLNLIYK